MNKFCFPEQKKLVKQIFGKQQIFLNGPANS